MEDPESGTTLLGKAELSQSPEAEHELTFAVDHCTVVPGKVPAVAVLLESCKLIAAAGPEVATEALQLAATPPFCPEQLHFHGPVPLTADAVPAEQRFVVGALLSIAPADDPHMPLIGAVAWVTVKDPAE